MKIKSTVHISGIIGKSGDYTVFIGFTAASLLREISFSDTLNEDTGEGYQRPYNKSHSLDFRNYINRTGSSTPPLTLNLRNDLSNYWEIVRGRGNSAMLVMQNGVKCLAQVDCQHRLGELQGVEVQLAFMTYIGLDIRQEMAIFNIINSKAKGLSSSLTDYHESKLINDLAEEAPHLFIARRLNEDPSSPWFKLIRYGGETTSGLKRRTSFRMMQKTVQTFLSQTKACLHASLEDKYQIVLNFWIAVKNSFSEEWEEHRNNLITKGVGLYSLMQVMGDLVKQAPSADFSVEYFEGCLASLKGNFDWSSHGRFAYVGGKKGVQDVYLALKHGLLL